MNRLIFTGKISKGAGKHKELGVPGKGKIHQAPEDWPELLFEGSLNIKINANGYPVEFSHLNIPLSTKSLDIVHFKPVFEIRQNEFELNLLRPTPEMKNKGDAQVWRAKILVEGNEENAWVLRRYGSGLADIIELVSDIKIREKYNLPEDKTWDCTLELYYD